MFTSTLTALGLSLCTQFGLMTCTDMELSNYWLGAGGMCGQTGCYWYEGCPNDRADKCDAAKPENECFWVSSYPTMSGFDEATKEAKMDGPGGKHYLCRKREAAVM